MRATATAREIARSMHDAAMGCVVVVDAEERPLGIVTDRDLLLRVVANRRDGNVSTAESCMSRPLHAIEADAPLERAIACMAEHGVRRVPVVRRGRLVGILSLDDLAVKLGREFLDLGECVGGAFHEAQRRAAIEHVREELESRLEGVRAQIDETGSKLREVVSREFAALRDRLWRGGKS